MAGHRGLSLRPGAAPARTGRYAGTPSYVIRGQLRVPSLLTRWDGFGPPMRYLQTVCGAPRHAGGAHWFPDTITVTVPFNRSGLTADRATAARIRIARTADLRKAPGMRVACHRSPTAPPSR